MSLKLSSIKKNVREIFIKISPVLMSKRAYKVTMKKKLNLKNPQTFNEKIQWLKLYYCPNNPLVIQCADKYAVRKYLEEKGCGQYLNKLIGVWDNVDDINWDKLPDKFALKCNHGCKFNIICEDKNKLDISSVKTKLNKWMETDYGLVAVEPHYSKIPRKIICEEFIENEAGDGVLPADYKIHCFHGSPQVVAYYVERDIKMKRSFYDVNGNPMKIGKEYYDLMTEKPKCFDEMLDVSRKLSEGFPYVRVDFYVSNDRPIFGELTFTPAGGKASFYTEEADILLGDMLDISDMM